MDATSPRCCRVFQTVIAVLFALTGVHFSTVSSFKVMEGGVASLSCQYSVKRFGLSRVCWGRGCGTFWCSNILVQTDENGVISKVEDRYRLTGDVLDGQMDLDIVNVRRTDSGPYCCRVDIDGIFNDKKSIMNLRVVKAPVTSSPTTTTTTTTTTTNQVTEQSSSTGDRVTKLDLFVLVSVRSAGLQVFIRHSVFIFYSELEISAVVSPRPAEKKLHPAALGLRQRGGLCCPLSLSSDKRPRPLPLARPVVRLGGGFPLPGLQTWDLQPSLKDGLFLLRRASSHHL